MTDRYSVRKKKETEGRERNINTEESLWRRRRRERK